MSNALVPRGKRGGVVPAICSAVLPGLGQLVKGDSDKAVGMFAVWTVAGASVLGAIPLVSSVAWLAAGLTWVVSVGDAYAAKRKR